MTVRVDRNAYKPGTCFNPDKKRYHTEEDAQAACDTILDKRHQEMSTYQCGRHWHLTSSPHPRPS